MPEFRIGDTVTLRGTRMRPVVTEVNTYDGHRSLVGWTARGRKVFAWADQVTAVERTQSEAEQQ